MRFVTIRSTFAARTQFRGRSTTYEAASRARFLSLVCYASVATLDYITFAIPVFSRYLWLCIDIICERAPSFKQLQHNPRQVACEHTMRGTRAPT